MASEYGITYQQKCEEMKASGEIMCAEGTWVLWPTSNKGAYTKEFLLYIAKYLNSLQYEDIIDEGWY